ncbi:MAG: hypothetical protein ABJD97_02710 [Betaproteobacteria bacterium]
MTHFTTTAAADRSTTAATTDRHDQPAILPRRGRLGSAAASVLVTTLVVGSVVLGMTDMAADATQMAVASSPAQHA